MMDRVAVEALEKRERKRRLGKDESMCNAIFSKFGDESEGCFRLRSRDL